MASSSASRSSVGGWMIAANPLNADDPDLGARRQVADERRRGVLGGPSRVGSMSSAHMLPDTSIASRIVVWLDGTASTATGRASASASRRDPGEQQRDRHVAPPARRCGPAAANSDRLE